MNRREKKNDSNNLELANGTLTCTLSWHQMIDMSANNIALSGIQYGTNVNFYYELPSRILLSHHIFATWVD
jgi:hypothetical protein